eukprot:1850474-Pyramimonas_sp.AAC.1
MRDEWDERGRESRAFIRFALRRAHAGIRAMRAAKSPRQEAAETPARRHAASNSAQMCSYTALVT